VHFAILQLFVKLVLQIISYPVLPIAHYVAKIFLAAYPAEIPQPAATAPLNFTWILHLSLATHVLKLAIAFVASTKRLALNVLLVIYRIHPSLAYSAQTTAPPASTKPYVPNVYKIISWTAQICATDVPISASPAHHLQFALLAFKAITQVELSAQYALIIV